MNKKQALIVLLICIVFIGGVAAISLLSSQQGWGWNWNWDWFNFGGQRVEIDESADFGTQGVKEILVSAPIGSIIVETGEPGVTLIGSITVREEKDRYLYVKESGGKLSIEFDPGNLPFADNNKVTLTVRLPKELAADLRVWNSSGGVDVKGIHSKNMDVSNSSGSIDITGCAGDELKVSLSSGNTTVDGAAFGSMRVNSQSGNIRLNDLAGALTMRHSSGNIDITDAKGAVEVWHSSGNVNIELSENRLPPVSVTLSSGNATLRAGKDASFTLDARTSSGVINSDFDILVSGSVSKGALKGDCNGGGETVKVSVSSGNVNLFKK